ncbi:hypothetical protein [Halorubellus sp. PRR65]|uniref:hypothetical protein n=1 Tax=Halorubellus sp. PRR65 TaxID=3098148 RepID=UPI002B256F19|nr:hypothetical protein [Halorubellus sp. PRR65]
MIYATRGLLEVLCEFADDAEPNSVTAALATTAAGDLDGDIADAAPEKPVFTDFYMPQTGESITAVFGMNLSTPSAQTQGRFVSHPDGNPEISIEDDLHAYVFVAVPPWTPENVAVYDRRSNREELVVVDAEPPEADI